MPRNQIVFVHGLGGHPQSTWGQFPELIAADRDLGAYGTISFGYPTSLFRLPFSSRSPKIQTLAGALRTFIEARSPDGDDLILVCHSLGGIIARRYLVDEVKRKAPLRVRGLLLYAVPTSGAGLAEIASHISWRHNQLRQLCRDSDLLRDLEADWETLGLSSRLRVRHVVAAQDEVVAEESARSSWGATNVDVIADRGHIDVVKPLGADDLPFLIFRNFVRSFTLGSGATPAPTLTATPARSPALGPVDGRRASKDRIALDKFEPLAVLGETQHSRIETCRYKGDVIVLKRTSEELCDIDALRAVMDARDDKKLLSAKLRSQLHVPQRVWREDGFVWEVQEFVDGVSLGALVNRNQQHLYGRFLDSSASALFRMLEALGRIGVIHRDINPYNLLLTKNGEFRLIDWTFCQRPGRKEESPVTTPGYTAPEQEHGRATHSSDWYSTGATLYFLANRNSPDVKVPESFNEGLERLDETGRRLEYDVGGEWRKGLSRLVSDVLEQEADKRPIPAKPFWKESSLAGSLFDDATTLQLGSKSHLIMTRGRYWVLPRDIIDFGELLEKMEELRVAGRLRNPDLGERLTELRALWQRHRNGSLG
jgi:pimeloyl-ACP methyl ester carboxylesterase